MASATLSNHGFPEGTTVEAYPARQWRPGSAPSGSPVDADVVTGSALRFDGLDEKLPYVAYAQGRGVGFMADVVLSDEIEGPPAGVLDRVEDLERLSSLVESESARKAGLPINAADEGVFGLGLATEAAAIQTLVNKAATDARPVEFRAGIYLVDVPVLLKSGVRLLMHEGAVFRSTSLTNAAIFANEDDANGNDDITIVGGEFDGNKASRPGAAGALLAFRVIGGTSGKQLRRINVLNAHVHDGPELGIQFSQVQGGSIRGCHVHDNGRDGITLYYSCQDIRIATNWVHDCGDDHIGLNAENGTSTGHVMRRISVSGNVLSGGTSQGAGIACRGARDTSISGNVVEQGFAAGISVSNWNTTPARNIVVSGNTLYKSGATNPATAGHAIEILGAPATFSAGGNAGCQSVRVTGNVIDSPRHIGVLLAANTGGDLERIAIHDNTIKLNVASGWSTTSSRGIYCQPTAAVKSVSVQGNHVEGAGNQGIYFNGSVIDGLFIHGNFVFDSGQSAAAEGIGVVSVVNASVCHNHCQDRQAVKTQTFGIVLSSPTGSVEVIGNNCNGNRDGRISVTGSASMTNFRYRDNAGSSPWAGQATVVAGAWTSLAIGAGTVWYRDIAVTYGLAFPSTSTPEPVVSSVTAGYWVTTQSRSNTGFTARVTTVADPGGAATPTIAWIAEPTA